jgi:hypothetical protein
MFHAETVSGWCLENNGFCTIVLTEEHSAEPRISNAPVLNVSPLPSPMAMTPMPAKETKVPIQASTGKRSPSRNIAIIAVKIGLTLMMNAAAPAETVVSPMFSIAV